MIVDPRLVTDGIRVKLASLGLVVGDAQAPAGAVPPYVAVFAVPGGRTTGTLGALNDDAEMVYQVSCWGKTREQAEWVQSKVLAGLLGIGTITVAGRTVRIDDEGFGGMLRDDTTSPPLFEAVPRFRVHSTPS